MSELQHYYDECAYSGSWKRLDPEECGCKGSGWFLSQVDTWHKCSIHHDGSQRHPEDDYVSEDDIEPEGGPLRSPLVEPIPTVGVILPPQFDEDDIPF